jgi:hypothetical protein
VLEFSGYVQQKPQVSGRCENEREIACRAVELIASKTSLVCNECD